MVVTQLGINVCSLKHILVFQDPDAAFGRHFVESDSESEKDQRTSGKDQKYTWQTSKKIFSLAFAWCE